MLFRSIFLMSLIGLCFAVNLPNIPTNFEQSDTVLSAISDDIAHLLEEEYLNYRKTGIESSTLKYIFNQLAKSHSKKHLFTQSANDLDKTDQFMLCTTCRASVNVVARMFRDDDGELNGEDNEKLAKEVMLEFCDRFKIQTEEVCSGLFDSNWPTIEYIIKNSVIDSRTFCSLFMSAGFCNVKNPEFNFTIELDKSGSEIDGPKKDIPNFNDGVVKVLHLTDIHYDPLYTPDSLADCEEPLCCQRKESGIEGTSRAAGYWGDYRDCDAPWHLIENAFEHIQKHHKDVEYIYHTGDIVDHMAWATSIEKNIKVITQVDDKIHEMFPNIPVFPCVGNHEPHPLNVFSPDYAPDNINTKWLYENLWDDWSKWLPSSAKDTVIKGGYYTVVPKEGFRIIALNNNDCYKDNWWVFHNASDKQPQLQWLHDTLLEAEKSKEYVHIIGHIPSGDGSCWNVWSREYNRMIERFSRIISGIFVGHSHEDEMNVHYSAKGYPVGITWNGGALTTYSNKNPNYRVYHMSQKTMEVVDHETWIFNLTEANLHGSSQEPKWFLEYLFSNFTNNTSPDGIDKLLDEFAGDVELLKLFWKRKMTFAEPAISKGCNRRCLKQHLCRLAVTVSNQRNRCNELIKKLDETIDESTTTSAPTEEPTKTTEEPTKPTEEPTKPTEEPTKPTEKPGGNGAASITAWKLSIIFVIFSFFKFIF